MRAPASGCDTTKHARIVRDHHRHHHHRRRLSIVVLLHSNPTSSRLRRVPRSKFLFSFFPILCCNRRVALLAAGIPQFCSSRILSLSKILFAHLTNSKAIPIIIYLLYLVLRIVFGLLITPGTSKARNRKEIEKNSNIPSVLKSTTREKLSIAESARSRFSSAGSLLIERRGRSTALYHKNGIFCVEKDITVLHRSGVVLAVASITATSTRCSVIQQGQ